MLKILVVEDEKNLRLAIVQSLKNDGYAVVGAADGEQGFHQFINERPDLIITDVMMPKINGYQLVKKVRETNKDIPILILTALETLNDKEQGFDSGSDDYLVKPVQLKEISMRVKALLRRAKINSENRLELAHTFLDSASQLIKINNIEVELTKKEFQLLFKLLSYPNIVFSRDQLLNEIWGYSSIAGDRTVDTHISWLREKAASPDYEILTIWGLGYKMVLK